MAQLNGMNMMLKSLGVDPEKIKEELTNTLNNATGVVKTEVQKLHNKIDAQQNTLNRMEQMLNAIMQHHGIVGIGGGMDNEHTAKVGTQFEERILTDGNNGG